MSGGSYDRPFDPAAQDSLAKLARLIAPGSTVLDLGAGSGILGRYLVEKKDCAVDGVEIDAAAAEVARTAYRLCLHADLETSDLSALFPGRHYDAVVCADILEHLHSPGRLLSQIAPLLNGTGRILISMPNVAHAGLIANLMAGELRYAPVGLLDATHLRFFTRKSLARLLRECGLAVVSHDRVVTDMHLSEFPRYLDALPPPLGDFLLAQPDALTYQFIVEAVPQERGEQEVALDQEEPGAIPELRFSCRLYWRSAEERYAEARSSLCLGVVGRDNQLLSLPFPASQRPICELRLDLTDRPGFLRLHQLRVRDASGGCLWSWDGSPRELESSPHEQLAFAVNMLAGAAVTAVATGNDCWMVVPIGPSVGGLKEGGLVELEVSWPESSDYLAIAQEFTDPASLTRRVMALRAERDHLASETATLQATIAVERQQRTAELALAETAVAAAQATLQHELAAQRERHAAELAAQRERHAAELALAKASVTAAKTTLQNELAAHQEQQAAELALAGRKAAESAAEAARLRVELLTCNAELDSAYRSRSWQITAPLRLAGRVVHELRQGVLPQALAKAILPSAPGLQRRLPVPLFARRLQESGLFDREWYARTNPDVAGSGIDPLKHFIRWGAAEGRDPHPLFDTSFYLESNPDVAAAGTNPLLHYLLFGANEGRDPHPLFDTSFYLESNPDVAAAGINPLLHYVRCGSAEGRDPGPFFDTSYYAEHNPDVGAAGMLPLVHYHTVGRGEGRAPQAPAQKRIRRGGHEFKPHHELAPVDALRDLAKAQQGSDPLLLRFEAEGLAYRPLISVLVPVFNTPPKYLGMAIDSVLAQAYPEWELCLCDDGSDDPGTLALLGEVARSDSRIRLRRLDTNRGISTATNGALDMAHGEFVAMLDHDDELLPDALLEIAKVLNRDPSLDALYTDQDYVEADGTVAQTFHKPDWSLEMFRGVMYVGHLLVVRRTLANDAGGFNPAFDNVQDFEFMLRVAERTQRIAHVPKILYHWRKIPGSVAFDGYVKQDIEPRQAAAVNAHFARCGVAAVAHSNQRQVHRLLLSPKPRAAYPRVSVIVRATGAEDHVESCVEQILTRGGGPQQEVIVSGGNLCEALARRLRAKGVILEAPRKDGTTAGSAGIDRAGGELIVSLSADLDVETQDWLEHLLFNSELPRVGCVSPVILSATGAVSSAGWVLGGEALVWPAMAGWQPDTDGYAGSLSCVREISAVGGDCYAVTRQVLDALGGLNSYFASDHFQAVELSVRALSAGLRNLCTPRVTLRRRTAAAHKGTGDDVDRLIFADINRAVISRGDAFHNPNFRQAAPGYQA